MSPAKPWALWVPHSAWNVTPCIIPQSFNLLSKDQREAVAASQEAAAGSCPNSTFPMVQLPTLCSGPGLSPAQNGDFVSHLVLGTLLGLFLGTGPAGQVCKSMTHTQKPAASASHSCHLPTSHPFLPLPAQGSLPSLLPTSHFKGRDFPRGLHLPLSFVSDENDLLPARVHRITAQSSRRLHPPQPTPNY